MRILQALLISAATLGLAACGPGVQAPSLLPRAVEKQPIDMPAAEANEPDTAVDPAVQATIARQVAAAQAADSDFTARRSAAEAAVAKAAGRPQGSELWIQAQESITSLESARTAMRDAAAAIDALRDDPANAAPGNRNAIDVAARQVAALDEAETAAVAALMAKLG